MVSVNPFNSRKHFLKPDEKKIQQLVSICQDGGVEAFGAIYDAYVDMVYRYVFYRIDREEVEDLVETVFVKVWENIDKYRPGEFPFSSWLFRVAHNLIVDYYRFHRKHISLNENLPAHVNRSEDDPADWAGKQLNQSYLRKGLVQLKESYQQVLVLKYLMGFDTKEVAQMMQRNVANIRILQYRALKALRQVLQGQGMESNEF